MQKIDLKSISKKDYGCEHILLLVSAVTSESQADNMWSIDKPSAVVYVQHIVSISHPCSLQIILSSKKIIFRGGFILCGFKYLLGNDLFYHSYELNTLSIFVQ